MSYAGGDRPVAGEGAFPSCRLSVASARCFAFDLEGSGEVSGASGRSSRIGGCVNYPLVERVAAQPCAALHGAWPLATGGAEPIPRPGALRARTDGHSGWHVGGVACDTSADGWPSVRICVSRRVVPRGSGALRGVWSVAAPGLARRSRDAGACRWRDRGGERQGAVPALQPAQRRAGAVSDGGGASGAALRPWQSAFLSRYVGWPCGGGFANRHSGSSHCRSRQRDPADGLAGRITPRG